MPKHWRVTTFLGSQRQALPLFSKAADCRNILENTVQDPGKQRANSASAHGVAKRLESHAGTDEPKRSHDSQGM